LLVVFIFCFGFRRQLSKLGCTCEIAGNGSTAIQLLEKRPERFSLILMDLEMPILGNFRLYMEEI
jgi:CheY-like chemotaxis protein